MKRNQPYVTSCLLAFLFLLGLAPLSAFQALDPMTSAANPRQQALPGPAVSSSPTPSTEFGLASPAVAGRIEVLALPGIGRGPSAITALGDKVYTLNWGTDNIAVIQSGRVSQLLPAGKRPAAMVADTAQGRLYYASNENKTITLFENDKVIRAQNVGEDLRTMLFFEGHLIVGLEGKGSLLVFDPNTLVLQKRIDFDHSFTVISIAGDSIRHRIYANLYEKTAVVDSTDWSVRSYISIKGSYETLIANPADSTFLVSVYDSDSRTEYFSAFDPDTGTERGRVRIGGDPNTAVADIGFNRVYIANSFTNDVSVIDPRAMTSVATIPVGMSPNGLALDERNHRLYVANYYGDSVQVIDTDSNRVAATIPLAMLPTSILADDQTNRVYLANASTDSVFVFEGARLVREVPVGRHPIDLAMDTKNHRLLVANQADGTLSIIEESDWSVTTTDSVSRNLSTVAVDSKYSRIFAGDTVLDLDTLRPTQTFSLKGMTLGSTNPPQRILIGPNNDRAYAIAWNGVPGSNSRSVVFPFDRATLQQASPLGYYGSTTAMAIDPVTHRLFSAGTHPLAQTNELSIFDSKDTKLFSLVLPARTLGMAYNPETRHLFLSQATSYSQSNSATPVPFENSVRILDSTTLGLVAQLPVDSPGRIARLGNMVYVVSRQDGSVTLVRDVGVPAPPSPTHTPTPTPWPTSPPVTLSPEPTRTSTRLPLPSPACAFPIAADISSRWNANLIARLGCPQGNASTVRLAAQSFERGVMIYRAEFKDILLLYSDKTWTLLPDTWQPPHPEDSCPSTGVPSGRTKPMRGFGKVWCRDANIRAKLGAATGGEVGLYSSPTVAFERGFILAGPESSQSFILYNDGKWE